MSKKDIEFKNLSPEFADIIKQIAANSANIEKLSFAYNDFNDREIKALSEALKKNNIIKSIDFSYCNISDKNKNLILKTVKNNPKIEIIGLIDKRADHDFNQVHSELKDVLFAALIPTIGEYAFPFFNEIQNTKISNQEEAQLKQKKGNDSVDSWKEKADKIRSSILENQRQY